MSHAAEYYNDSEGGMAASDAAFAREHDLIAPRISIEAFCATPAFATAMQTAARDRRMAKARCTVGMGGAGAAAKRYSAVPTPNLVVIETLESGFGVLKELERVAEMCSEDVRVIVAGPSNDVTLYRELIRQGVSEYLVSPPAPMQIIEAITTVFESPEAAPAAHSLAVYGVRGGVGASALAHNIASILADRAEKETVLVDLDLEFGTAALDFNVESKTSVADALLDLDELDDVKLSRLLYEQAPNMKLLAAPADVKSKAQLDGDSMLGLLDTVRFACDYVVLDLPHAWTPAVQTALRQSESVALVATPDLASLRNLKAVYDWLVDQRQHDLAPKIILNQVGMPKRPEIAAKEFVDIIGAPVDLTVAFEPAVFGAAQNDGKILSEIGGAKKIVEQLEGFVDGLRGAKGQNAAKPGLSGGLASGLAGGLAGNFSLSSLLSGGAKRG